MVKADSGKKKQGEQEEALSTRERITQVALEVFAERGLHGTTMVEIAKRAGVTGGALYRYFENKEDLFNAVVEEHSVVFSALDMVRPLLPELEPKTALKFIAQGMFLYFFTELEFMRMVVGESVKDPGGSRPFYDMMLTPARDFVRECIELWQEQGLLGDEVDPDVASMAFLGILGYFMVEKAFLLSADASEFNVDEMAERFVSMFLEGILKRE